MWYVISWWLYYITVSFWWAVGSFYASLLIPNITCFSVIYITISVFVIGLLLILNSYLKKRKNIKDFLREQEVNKDNELLKYTVITKKQLIKGIFKYNIPCNDFSPFAFSVSLSAKESEEILSKYW